MRFAVQRRGNVQRRQIEKEFFSCLQNVNNNINKIIFLHKKTGPRLLNKVNALEKK